MMKQLLRKYFSFYSDFLLNDLQSKRLSHRQLLALFFFSSPYYSCRCFQMD